MFEKLFNLDGITELLDSIGAAANQRASAEKELREKAQVIQGDVLESATEYNTEAADTLRIYEKTKTEREAAANLADSDNIFDRISLIGAQTLNPRAYTREGRSNQRAEASQELALRGQIHNVQTTVAGAQLAKAQADAAVQTADVDGRMNALKMQIEGLQLSNEAVAQTELMRQNNLILQDRKTLEQAAMGPVEASGKIKIGDMDYSPLEIREQARKLQTREMLSLMSPQASDPDYRGKLNAQQSLILQDMNLTELEQLRQNDYMMPDGTKVLAETFDGYWNRANLRQQEVIEQKVNESLLPNQVRTMLSEGQQLGETVRRKAEPGTPLAMEQSSYMNTLSTAAKLVADATPENEIISNTQAAALTSAAQQRLIKAVEKETLIRANNDKDLASIYRDQFLGVPVSPQRIENLLTERYAKGTGFGEVLPQKMSARLMATADKELQTLRQQQAQMNLMGDSKRPEKELKQEAIQKAFQKERSNIGVTAMNNIQVLSNQRSDNPGIQAGLAPQQLMEIQNRSGIIAQEEIRVRYNLTPEQMQSLVAGDAVGAGLDPQVAATYAEEINSEAIMQEYNLLEAEKSGLGYGMQQWYSSALPEMAKTYSDRALDPIEQSFAGDAILQQAQQFNMRYTMVDETVSQRGKMLVTQVATKAKEPTSMWPMLVQMSDRLAESEKQSIYYDVIEPAIKQAGQLGLNSEQTTALVFDTLNQTKTNDKVLNSSITTLLRDLPAQVDRFEGMWDWALQLNSLPGQSMLGLETDAQRAATSQQIRKSIPWLKPTAGQQQQKQNNPKTGGFDLTRDPRDLLLGR